MSAQGDYAGRGNDDGPSLDVERLLADRERPAIQYDEVSS